MSPYAYAATQAAKLRPICDLAPVTGCRLVERTAAIPFPESFGCGRRAGSTFHLVDHREVYSPSHRPGQIEAAGASRFVTASCDGAFDAIVRTPQHAIRYR